MPRPIDPAQLTGKWIHSHEEDGAGTMVFRRAGYAFPPARGREAFELFEDGTATDRPIAPDDRLVDHPARWELSGPNRLRLNPTGSSGRAREMMIVDLAPGRLVIHKAT